MLPYWAMLHYFRTHEREERGEEGKGGRREDGREEKEFKYQKDGDTEKKVRNHKHTHKIKHLLC